ncbi:ABC transporter substrate-binding protein [uncultured Ilyobacter sp.]|uniref:ABC transporter substrate-binding protein n=1 Tax=uncultured Ilyobacter sp. TaxID=544433 RepID=UPI002AA93E11|nr:ABC transporter substrate-binding protein [uncultured Ilyobacter sp.]
MKIKNILFPFIFGFIVILFASCFKEKKPIRIAANNWPSCELWYIAEEQGYFQDLPVEIVRFTKWSDSMASLYLGKTDLIHSTYFNAVSHAEKGEKSKIILMTETIFGNQGLVVNKEIHSARDLKGKKIAVEIDRDEHYLLYKFLRMNNMSENDIEHVSVSSFEEASKLFIDGKVDAALTYEPYISTAVDKADGKLLMQSNRKLMSTDVILAREKSLDKRPEDYAKLIKAWYKAQEFVKNNPEKAYKIMASNEKITVDEFKKFYEKFIFFSLDENIEEFSSGKIDEELKNINQFMIETKLTTKKIDTKKLYDSSVVEMVKGDI